MNLIPNKLLAICGVKASKKGRTILKNKRSILWMRKCSFSNIRDNRFNWTRFKSWGASNYIGDYSRFLL